MPESDLTLLLYSLLIGLAAGGIGGILAGLAGVGGGLIYVPVFYAFMPAANHGIAIQVMASLLAIVLTGLFSSRSHYRLGHIHRASCQRLAPGLIVGSALGLWSTLQLSEVWILLCLAGLDLWIARDYGRNISLAPHKPSLLPYSILAVPVGYISGLLGVGGGTMLVPLLRRSLPLRQAVGTSALCGVLIAFSATAINLLAEPKWHTALHQQWLFIAGALTGILLALPKATQWAARLHQQFSESALQWILKVFFLTLACGLLLAAILKFAETG